MPCLLAWCFKALHFGSFTLLVIPKRKPAKCHSFSNTLDYLAMNGVTSCTCSFVSTKQTLWQWHEISCLFFLTRSGKRKKKMLLGHFSLWILAFHWKVPISIHFLCCSGKLYTAFQVTKQTQSLIVLQTQVRKVGNFYFPRQGVHE